MCFNIETIVKHTSQSLIEELLSFKSRHSPNRTLICFTLVRLAGLEPARLASRDFLTTIVFTTGICRLWSGLYLHHSISALGACRLVSTPSWYFYQAWLGISMLKPSPNLTDSTPIVSDWALKLSISPLRLPITPQSHNLLKNVYCSICNYYTWSSIWSQVLLY